MPRAARVAPRGMILHVLNRGNEQRTMFRNERDCVAFLWLFGQIRGAAPMRVLQCRRKASWTPRAGRFDAAARSETRSGNRSPPSNSAWSVRCAPEDDREKNNGRPREPTKWDLSAFPLFLYVQKPTGGGTAWDLDDPLHAAAGAASVQFGPVVGSSPLPTSQQRAARKRDGGLYAVLRSEKTSPALLCQLPRSRSTRSTRSVISLSVRSRSSTYFVSSQYFITSWTANVSLPL